MIYFVAISLSVFFAWLLGRVKGNAQPLCLLAAVLIPSLVWGIRSTDMGYDVNLYGLPIWNYSAKLHSFDYSGVQWGYSIEKGYLFLNYVTTRFFQDIHWLFFILAFCSCFAVLSSLIWSDFRKVAWLGYAYYLLIFFPRTINIVRQGFAMAILVAAISAFFQRKWKIYICLVLVGTLIHNSAIIALSFPVIYLILKNNNGIFRQLLLALIVLTCTIFAESILSQFFLFNDKYDVYLNGTFKPHFSIFSLINFPFIAVFFFYYKSFRRKFSFFPEEVFFLIAGMILCQLSWIIAVYMMRVAQPYNIFIIFAPMLLVSWLEQKKNNMTPLIKSFFFFFALLYFVLVFVVNGESGIYPYQSELLDYALDQLL